MQNILRGQSNKTYKISLLLTILILYFFYFIWNSLFANRIKVNNGCGWDGSQYCELFFDQLVMEPYSRRIFAPQFVSLFFEEPITGFFFINNILILLTMLLIYSLIRQNNVINFDKKSFLVIVLTLAVYIFSRHGLHLNFVYPVLTEHFYFFFICLSMLILFFFLGKNKRNLQLILFTPLALSVFSSAITRESLGPIFFIFGLWLMKNRHWLASVSFLTGSLLGIVISFSQPTNSKAAPLLEIVIHWLRMNLSTGEGIIRFTTMFLLAVGPFIFLINQRVLKNLDFREKSILAFSVIFTAASSLGGGDTDRILFPVGILLLIIFARLSVRTNHLFLTFVSLSLAYYFWQLPFKVIGQSGEEILEFYGLRVTSLSNLMDNALNPMLTTFPLLLAGVYFYFRDFRLTSSDKTL